MMIGCASSTPNSDAGKESVKTLSALILTAENMDQKMVTPAFDPAITSYTVKPYIGQPVTLVATLTSPKAAITINGAVYTPGTPFKLSQTTNVPVLNYINVIAQDGSVTTYNVTVTNNANTPTWVLDSVNGSPVPSAKVTVYSAAGKALESNISVASSGLISLALDPTKVYSIKAKGTGTAESLFSGFDRTKETQANLYCHPLGMSNFTATAPVVTSISYGNNLPAGAPLWTPVTGNTIRANAADVTRLLVTAQGVAGIAPTAWSGFGMGIAADQPAWIMTAYGPSAILENSVPVTVGDATLYESQMTLPVVVGKSAGNGSHYLDVVVYDVANNRTEKKVYLTFADAAADLTQPDISALTPTNVVVQMVTYGLSRDNFKGIHPDSVTPLPGTTSTVEPDISFNLLDSAEADVKILGYDVARSTDGKTFTKIATVQYPYPITPASLGADSFTYTDSDPSLKAAVGYYYQITPFTGNTTNNKGYSKPSPVVASMILPPWTPALSAPVSGAVSSILTPTFTFKMSNPDLFAGGYAEEMDFFLYIREKSGLGGSKGIPFAVDLTTVDEKDNFVPTFYYYDDVQGWVEASGDSPWNVTVNEAFTEISIAGNTQFLSPGITYEWSIFGTKGSPSYTTSDAAYFISTFLPAGAPADSPNYGIALSMGSTYEKSYGAPNGFFTLIMSPNAK